LAAALLIHTPSAAQQEFTIYAAAADDLHIAAEMRGIMAAEMGNDWDTDHPGWRQRFAEYFSNKQKRGDSQTFFARVGDEVIGMATVSLVDEYHAYVRGRLSGRVNSVYVARQHRRKGIGRALMHAALEWLRGKGCAVARLNASEEGVALYESMGFQKRREYELFF
jgi:GNAT superfamily N-acetyltransferase